MTDIKHTNRLINETSPYLLQHAHNPVDWYPWGQEALDRAKTENKPIFLSIGYSACHWCHVMEHECFENENIAVQLNGSFICIKVDREERPDLDAIYMEAIQALTGSGGWPLTIFLTPELKPFYGGTYFPPEDQHGLPGLIRVLDIVATAYQDRHDEIERVAGEIVEYLKKSLKIESNQDVLNSDMIHEAYNNIRASFDTVNGGFGTAPKFPQSMILEFLLRFHYRTGDKESLQMVEKTLDKMAAGGIYDQIGGGFHRYSVDDRWLVPHFEKMLYDNALLSRVYLHAYQVTGEVYYRSVVEETLDYIQRDMRDKEGGFYSAQDADSEGVEGKYYIWTRDEINYVLGIEEAEIFTELYGVSTGGNFEGKNILNTVTKIDDMARKRGLQVQDIEERIRLSKKKLLQKRFQRIPPLRDEKSLTGWNALMMAAFTEAGMALNRKDYLEVAIDCGEFIIRSLYKDKVLKHSFKDTKTGEDGFLQDYAFVCEAYLLLYQATFESKWFTMSLETAKQMVSRFWDPDIKTFYDTDKNVQSLIMRPRTIYDNAI
ncbi:MAG: thioredoxin domain-containing protein, partial [Chloroflexi bacterium]|nr:thioredoxin domain-containing protein [Chloroflexota bacterium]